MSDKNFARDAIMNMDTQEALERLRYQPRRTGKTTTGIMVAIATAMKHPGREYRITDHYMTKENIHNHVVPRLREIIARIGLDGFDIYQCGDNWFMRYTNPLTK